MNSILTEGKERITLHHNHILYAAHLAEAGWSCDCPEHADGDLVMEREEVLDHLKSLKESLEEEFGPHVEVPERLSDQLLTTPTLRSLGLAINTSLRLPICLSCERAVIPSHIPTHLRRHKIPPTPINNLLSKFNLLTDFPEPSDTPRPFIEGVEVYDALGCDHCSSAYSTMESLMTHHYKKHAKLRRTENPRRVYAQQLSKGGKDRTLVIVDMPEVLPQQSTSIADSLKELMNRVNSTAASDQQPLDVRNVASWTRILRWHEQVAKYDPKTLIALIAPPAPDEFPRLQEAVTALFMEACSYISKTPVLILQRLVSPYIAKEGISNTPFRKHQDHEARMKDYCVPVIQLLCMLFRRNETYPIDLPPDTEALLASAKSAVQAADSGSTELARINIQYLLIKLWTNVYVPTELTPVVDPTLHFLMISTLKEDGSFQQPKSFTNTIARLEYDIRVLFLKYVHELEGTRLPDAYMSVEKYLQEKLDSTFNSLRTHQHLFTSVVYSTMALPSIWWASKDYKSMIFKGTIINISHFTEMVALLDIQMRDIWEDEILCGLGLRVSYDRLVDDLSDTNAGYSFMHDPRNANIFDDKLRLARGIALDANLSSKFISYRNGDQCVWSAARLRQWLASYAELQLLHIVRALLTGGSPGRGTEMTGMLLTNTSAGGIRNLVVFGRTLSLLCTYTKTSALSGHDRLIPHGMDGFGSDLLIQDLAIARPFAELATYMVNPNPAKLISMYRRNLFVNKDCLFTTEDISNKLRTITTSVIGRGFGISDNRHYSTGFRRMLLSRMNALYEDDENDNIAALQSGHTRFTENRVYGISADNLSGASEDLLPLFLDASMDWQRQIRVVPGGMNLRYDEATCNHFDSLQEQGRIAQMDTKEGLTTQIQKWIDSAVEQQTKAMKAILSDMFGFKIYPSPEPSPSSPEPDYLALALMKLRKLLGNFNANWVSEGQKTSVDAALALEGDVVSILPTGGGKSMIAVLPSLVQEEYVTLLVIPLISLLEDYMSRLTLMGVLFDVYKKEPISPAATLLLVSADMLESQAFQQHILILDQKKKVARMVFDEAHIPLHDHKYRHALRSMYAARKDLHVQYCLLSATIPPRAETDICRFYGLSTACKIIRECTNRPELQYEWYPPAGDVVQMAIATASKHLFQHEGERGLIFVPRYDLGKPIAEALGCAFYSSEKSVTREHKKVMHADWIAGKHRFMVCTSAFGAGNDYRHTTIVIHAGTPYNMAGYIQEVSRGGRDGRRAHCVLIPSAVKRSVAAENEIDAAGVVDMAEALKQTTCIRSLLTQYADGTGITCASDSRNVPCSRCESPPPPPKRAFGTVFAVVSEDAKRRKIQEVV